MEVSKSVGKMVADDTLQETNISPKKCHFEDYFPNFPRWDMLIPWRVFCEVVNVSIPNVLFFCNHGGATFLEIDFLQISFQSLKLRNHRNHLVVCTLFSDSTRKRLHIYSLIAVKTKNYVTKNYRFFKRS